jgi:hypothetical protein
MGSVYGPPGRSRPKRSVHREKLHSPYPRAPPRWVTARIKHAQETAPGVPAAVPVGRPDLEVG